MKVLLFGASGRVGQRITDELLARGHEVTGVSRSGDIEGSSDPDFEVVAGDATDADRVAALVEGHDAVASALGPPDGADPSVLSTMAEAVLEGMKRTDADRLVWTGGAGGLRVGAETRLIETDAFPEEVVPIARAHIDALEIIRGAEAVEWSYVAPAAVIEPGERTGTYRSAAGELVTDDDGDSYISMEDFAVAFVDELERGDAVRTQLGVGH
ncbi:NAD(P)H-binding protein [Halobellus sp. GM3]|uniref:NAD(P)H-binding protein n=1 Tax=Halobellus sp. GM3 TaxID=3458410 RepID=UPI00403D70AD